MGVETDPVRHGAIREGLGTVRRHRRLAATIVVLTLVAGGVLGALAADALEEREADVEEEEEGGGGPGAGVAYGPVIIPSEFSTEVDNPLFPLVPGMRWTYETKTGDGTERDVVVVTNATRVIMGVTCVEVSDNVSVGGSVTEATLDWYAQDVHGNVWYFGESSKEYDGGGVVSTAGSWEAGVGGAKPGIIMLADPEVGLSYRQEYLRGEAEDMALVLSKEASATVPYGPFPRALQTREWTPLEPKVAEDKYYAAGIGCVLEVAVMDGGERTELVAFTPAP